MAIWKESNGDIEIDFADCEFWADYGSAPDLQAPHGWLINMDAAEVEAARSKPGTPGRKNIKSLDLAVLLPGSRRWLQEVKDPGAAPSRPELEKIRLKASENFLRDLEHVETIERNFAQAYANSSAQLEDWFGDGYNYPFIIVLGLDGILSVKIPAPFALALRRQFQASLAQALVERAPVDIQVLDIQAWERAFPQYPIRRLSMAGAIHD